MINNPKNLALCLVTSATRKQYYQFGGLAPALNAKFHIFASVPELLSSDKPAEQCIFSVIDACCIESTAELDRIRSISSSIVIYNLAKNTVSPEIRSYSLQHACLAIEGCIIDLKNKSFSLTLIKRFVENADTIECPEFIGYGGIEKTWANGEAEDAKKFLDRIYSQLALPNKLKDELYISAASANEYSKKNVRPLLKVSVNSDGIHLLTQYEFDHRENTYELKYYEENFGHIAPTTFRYITYQCDGIIKVSLFASLARCSGGIYEVLGGTQAVLKKYIDKTNDIETSEDSNNPIDSDLKEVS